LVLPQPRHRTGEDGLRAVAGHPRLIGDPRRQFRLHLGERLQSVRLLDLGLMLKPCRPPLQVLRQTRRIIDTQLFGEVVDQLRRHVQRIGQEHPQIPHRDHLEGEAQPVVVPPPRADQPAVLIVQVEEPFQLHPRQRREPAVAGHTLIITHRHGITSKTATSPGRLW
jgi:hypothetical protein